MMRRVPIISIGNSSVESGDGVIREVIGSGRAAVGDAAWAMGDFVFYPGQPASRPPILWADNNGGDLLVAYDDGTYDWVDSNTLEATNAEPIPFKNWPAEYLENLQNELGSPDLFVAYDGDHIALLAVYNTMDENWNFVGRYYCFDLQSTSGNPVFSVDAGQTYEYYGFYFEVSNSGAPCFGGVREKNVSGVSYLYVDNCTGGELSSQQINMSEELAEIATSKISEQSGWLSDNRHVEENYLSEWVRNEYGGTDLNVYVTEYQSDQVAFLRAAEVETSVEIPNIEANDSYIAGLAAANPKTKDFIAGITFAGSSSISITSEIGRAIYRHTKTSGVKHFLYDPICAQPYCPVNPVQYITNPYLTDGPWGFPWSYLESGPMMSSNTPEGIARTAQMNAAVEQNEYPFLLRPRSSLNTLTAQEGQICPVYYTLYGTAPNQYATLGLFRYEKYVNSDGEEAYAWESNGMAATDGYKNPQNGESKFGPFHGYGGLTWLNPFPACVNTSSKQNEVKETFSDLGEVTTRYIKRRSVTDTLIVNGTYKANASNPTSLNLVSNSLINQIRGWETYFPKHLEYSGHVGRCVDENDNCVFTSHEGQEYVTYGCIYYGEAPTGSGTGYRTITKDVEGGAEQQIELPYASGNGAAKMYMKFENDSPQTYINDLPSPIDYSASSGSIPCIETVDIGTIVFAFNQFFLSSKGSDFERKGGLSGTAINSVIRKISKGALKI